MSHERVKLPEPQRETVPQHSKMFWIVMSLLVLVSLPIAMLVFAVLLSAGFGGVLLGLAIFAPLMLIHYFLWGRRFSQTSESDNDFPQTG